MRFSVRGVLFDLDGTLVDSGPAITRSWVRFAIEYGIRLTDLVTTQGQGRRSQDVVADLVPAGARTAACDRVHALELADQDEMVAVPGAAALLAALPRDAWGIVTSGSRPLASARLVSAGLGQFVDRLLVTGEEVSHGKPHPAPYLAGARALGLDPADCLAVEDAPAGVASAAAAGMATLGVTITTPAAGLPADAVVSDLLAVRVVPDDDGAADDTGTDADGADRAASGRVVSGRVVLEVDTGPVPREPVHRPVPDRLLEQAAAAGDPGAAAALAASRVRTPATRVQPVGSVAR